MKKHNLRKAAAGVMVMALGLSLAGCGNATNSNSDTQSSTIVTQETVATVTVQPTTAEVTTAEATTEAPTTEINLERSMLTNEVELLVEVINVNGLSDFISNFGVRLIKKGETVDLRDYCDFNALDYDQKLSLAYVFAKRFGEEMTKDRINNNPVYTNKVGDVGICLEYVEDGRLNYYYEYFN